MLRESFCTLVCSSKQDYRPFVWIHNNKKSPVPAVYKHRRYEALII